MDFGKDVTSLPGNIPRPLNLYGKDLNDMGKFLEWRPFSDHFLSFSRVADWAGGMNLHTIIITIITIPIALRGSQTA